MDVATYATLERQDTLWQAQCVALGWAHVNDHAPPPAPAPAPVPRWGWWRYYSHRMTLRSRVRAMLRQYVQFLSPAGRAALQPGCAVATLRACEARLQRHQLSMPWELWEVYRFKNGQADLGLHVAFFNGSRFLPCQDAVLLHCAALEQGGLAEPRLMEVGTPERGGRCHAVSLVDGSVWWVAGFASRKLSDSFVGHLQQLLA